MTDVRLLAEKIFLMRGMFFDTKVGQEIHVAKIESLLVEMWDERLKESRSAAFKEAAEIAEHFTDVWHEPTRINKDIADKLRRKSEGA